MVYSKKARGTVKNTGNMDIDDGYCADEMETLRITYTNIDGILSSVLEVKDYLREKSPDVLCLTETKLREEIQLSFREEGYNLWRRDRQGKGGGGILVLVKENVKVEDVKYGDGMVEVVNITTRTRGGGKRKIVVTYVPPKTGISYYI